MRTTIEIPDAEHALFANLAHARQISLGTLIVELARRGLDGFAMSGASSEQATVDPVTGLGVFRSGRLVSTDDVRAFLEGS